MASGVRGDEDSREAAPVVRETMVAQPGTLTFEIGGSCIEGAQIVSLRQAREI